MGAGWRRGGRKEGGGGVSGDSRLCKTKILLMKQSQFCLSADGNGKRGQEKRGYIGILFYLLLPVCFISIVFRTGSFICIFSQTFFT